MSRFTFTHQDRARLTGWLEPSTAEVLIMRSRIVSALATRPATQTDLRSELGVDHSMEIAAGNFSADRQLVGEVITDADPAVLAVREAFTFDEAVAQLEHDRVIEEVPERRRVRVTGKWVARSSSGGVGEDLEDKGAANTSARPLRLVSSGRGWTTTDHEAFDPAAYRLPPRSPLVTPDGQLLISEAIEAHRLGRHLSASMILFIFVETAWWQAARRIAPASNPVATLVADPRTNVSSMQKKVLEYFESMGLKFESAILRSWADSTRQVRNFGAHGSILAATSGSFTETASAVWIVNCYQHLAGLEQALVASGV